MLSGSGSEQEVGEQNCSPTLSFVVELFCSTEINISPLVSSGSGDANGHEWIPEHFKDVVPLQEMRVWRPFFTCIRHPPTQAVRVGSIQVRESNTLKIIFMHF